MHLSDSRRISGRSTESLLSLTVAKASIHLSILITSVRMCIRFYHSAIINTHDVHGGGNTDYFWDLAKSCYTSFNNSKKSNKHFTDLNDLNLLMCKAIDNPSLTPSSSLRTSFMALWEDPKVDDSNKSVSQEIGLLDCVDCASVHGIGSSIAVFDTIRDGALDCTCVYPTPLHSREQMEELVADMKRILIQGSLNFCS
ncbi:hypothetical protein Sjap_001125 [Stephania japonica]|uniref:Uncharacterized protein n=1 Tax=Stephania japonica TaxID=461633 RepID=A0AAP0KLX0_9MAGN